VVQPTFTWSLLSGTGSVDANGLYWAPNAAGSATVKAALGAISATATVSVSPEELVWYQANAASGTTLTDSSGHGKNATTSGSIIWSTGAAGNALKLTNGYAQLPTGILSGVTDVTISAWVKIDTLSSWSRIFDFGTGTTTNMFLTPRNGNSNVVRFAITTGGSGGEDRIDGTAALATGSWQMVTVTIAGSVGTLYVNGIAVGTNTGMTLHPGDLGSTTLNYLGKSQYADPAFLGSIDDFRIYGRALSAAEVLRLMKPAVAVAALGTPNPTGGTTAQLKVTGNDALSTEAGLTYTWATTGSPPAPVNFSANGTNAAKNTTATFTKPGTYNFQVTMTNSVGQSTTSTTSVTVTTSVVGRYLFYNGSTFDTSNDNAIAPDKTALLPGQTSALANYSSYSRGINGIMIDIAGPVGTLSPADFVFAVGNDSSPAGWTSPAQPVSITMRPGQGPGGSTRVEIVWADNTIVNKWLQVTLKANSNTGLPTDDVFYFGSAVGESGNSTLDMKVNAADQLATRQAAGVALITSPFDYNRDGVVDFTDEGIARTGYTYFLNEVHIIQAPGVAGAGLGPAMPAGVPASPFISIESGGAPAPALFVPPPKEPLVPLRPELLLADVTLMGNGEDGPRTPLGLRATMTQLIKATLVKISFGKK